MFIFIRIAFSFYKPGASVLHGEDVIQLGFGQQVAFQHHFAHALAGFGADLPDDVTVVVANERVQIGDDTDRVEDVVFADFSLFAVMPLMHFFQQVVAGVGQDVDRLEHRLPITGSITFSCSWPASAAMVTQVSLPITLKHT